MVCFCFDSRLCGVLSLRLAFKEVNARKGDANGNGERGVEGRDGFFPIFTIKLRVKSGVTFSLALGPDGIRGGLS